MLDILRDPIWQFVGVVIALVPIIYGLIRWWTRKRTRKSWQTNLISLDFSGSGQTKIGRFDVHTYNHAEKAIYHVRLKILLFNRSKRWRFWQSSWIPYENGENNIREYIAPQQRETYVLDLFHLELFMKENSLESDWQTNEPTPPLYDLLYPTPILLRFTLTFALDTGQPMLMEYSLRPQARFPENLLGDGYHKHNTWQFMRLR